VPVTPADLDEAFSNITGRWDLVRRPTYAQEAVKELTLARGKRALSGQEYALELGTIIHVLLETAMACPSADLEKLASESLAEQGLDRDLTSKVVAAVRAVLGSRIWARAQASPHRLVEVPIQVLQSVDETPQVLRGVIDLAFREADGWVIVDYKTDSPSAGGVAALVGHYRPQVRAYAEAWHKVVGEPVKEVGLYFTEVDQYVTV
jgi:ATP-dependent helicase/nuclease subunit A